MPGTFDRAIQPGSPTQSIDVQVAKRQHERYCAALESAGLELTSIEPDDRYPDCCYVEDTAVVVGEKAIVAAMAAPSRRGEAAAVEEELRDHKEVHHISPPATLDGGDVLRIGQRIFVGLTRRTNQLAADQLRGVLEPDGYEVVQVAVRDVLHLKSACTHVGEDVILFLPGHLDKKPFARYRRNIVPADEAHAANCLSVNGRVLIPTHAPRTRAQIEALGFQTMELEISESRKAAGLLTCSSIIF